MSRALILVPLLLLGCKSEPSSLELERQRKDTEPKEKANVTVVKPPVPYGKKLDCERLFDAAALTAGLGQEVTLATATSGEKDSTSVCSIKLAGTPPTAKQQERAFNENNRVLGVLPGDEICQVTLYCGFMHDAEEMKKKCKEDGQEVSNDIGLVTCVKTFEAGADYRYVVSALDADSKCKVTVNPGPSVKDREQPMKCAAVVADLLDPSKLGGE